MTTSVRLTKRESQVLELRASGLRNTDIAERLVIARQTVEAHSRHIHRKTKRTGFALGFWYAQHKAAQ